MATLLVRASLLCFIRAMEPGPGGEATVASDEEGPVPFGRYQLLRRIGAGGMGEVFLARDESAQQPRACVVKKVLSQLVQNQNFIKRFIDESKVVVRLNHPNIARVYAMGEVAGEYFLAMEYVQGKTISRFARRLRERKQQLSVEAILLLGERICQGLAYAHEAVDEEGNPLQLVHRDLSPANVCVGYQGEVKIIDFGAAQSTLKEAQTAPRVVIGNLTYMSPEQAQKQIVDGRADIYSLAVTLWELFAWMWLPQKGDPLERWRRAANPYWEPPSRHRKDLPPEVDDVLAKALRKEARERYADAREFGKELARLRAKLGPDMDDDELGRQLSAAFRKEKAEEDAALVELLGGQPIGESPTDITKAHRFVPPTAMAFEHRAVEPPPRVTDPASNPGEANDPKRTVEMRRARTVTFGIPIAPANRIEEEQALLRELAPEEEGIDVELESLEAQLPRRSSTRPPPNTDAQRTEVAVAVTAAPTASAQGPSTGRLLLVGALVFLAAVAIGFGTVWLLAD